MRTIAPNEATVPTVTHQFAEPPPTAWHGPRLSSRVGWVRGTAIGFRGFASAEEAAQAARVAYRTLAGRLELRVGGRPYRSDIGAVSLDGNTVLAGRLPIARVVTPDEDRESAGGYGLEIQAPVRAGENEMHRAALAIYRTLRRSGVRWQMFGRHEAKTARLHSPAAESHSRPAAGAAASARMGWRALDLPPAVRRKLSERLATMAVIAALFVMVAGVDRLIGDPSPNPVPLWLVAVAGGGSALVAMLVGRLQPRPGRNRR
jgi:hypothetical protein